MRVRYVRSQHVDVVAAQQSTTAYNIISGAGLYPIAGQVRYCGGLSGQKRSCACDFQHDQCHYGTGGLQIKREDIFFGYCTEDHAAFGRRESEEKWQPYLIASC